MFFLFNSNSYSAFSEQTVETLTRRRFLLCLIWVCAVCLCHTKGTLGLYGLKLSTCRGCLLIIFANGLDLDQALIQTFECALYRHLTVIVQHTNLAPMSSLCIASCQNGSLNSIHVGSPRSETLY